MDQVGKHLRKETLNRTIQIEKDLFGRSAFNRFYYAAYWETRELLRALNSNWGSTAHKAIPELLTGQIRNMFTKAIAQASKVGDKELIDLCSSAKSSAINLSILLKSAYSARVMADYSLETPITFSSTGRDFLLEKQSILSAQEWPQKAKGYSSTIKQAWKQIT
jgi:hypothetical protein